jgi:hypothetical protein
MPLNALPPPILITPCSHWLGASSFEAFDDAEGFFDLSKDFFEGDKM